MIINKACQALLCWLFAISMKKFNKAKKKKHTHGEVLPGLVSVFIVQIATDSVMWKYWLQICCGLIHLSSLFCLMVITSAHPLNDGSFYLRHHCVESGPIHQLTLVVYMYYWWVKNVKNDVIFLPPPPRNCFLPAVTTMYYVPSSSTLK